MKTITQITSESEEKMDKAIERRYLREVAERRAAQIEAEFYYWTGIVFSGIMAVIFTAIYIIAKKG